jgi:hypothetical protein
MSYTDLGYRTAPWTLPGSIPIAGVAVDGTGSVYVSRGEYRAETLALIERASVSCSV